MHTKESLMEDLSNSGFLQTDTILIHSSMKSIGEVEGRAETVLDAMMEYFSQGLLVLPAHTWSYINKDCPVFDVQESQTCVGILTELFRKRNGVIRTLHPTHSLSALKKCKLGDADSLTFHSGDLFSTTLALLRRDLGLFDDFTPVILNVGNIYRRRADSTNASTANRRQRRLIFPNFSIAMH